MTARNVSLALVIVFAFTLAAAAQALSVDPPAQIGAEIKRVNAAWGAWRASANPKLEQTLLTNPHAATDIARDEQGAMQYLDARRRLFEKMAAAFAVQIAAIRTADPEWNRTTVEQAERQKLAELLSAEDRLLKVTKGADADPARDMLIREQREKDFKTVADLKRTINHRLETLEALAGDEREAREQLDALAGNLEQVRRHFQDLAASTEAEKAEWQDYFSDLRQVVVRSGAAQQSKKANASGAGPGSAAKLPRDR
jgi:chromosome segregation ATPase